MKKVLVGLGLIVLGALFSKSASAASKCQDFESKLCMQLYAPVWCVSLSVGGEVVAKPLFAKASNGCVAINQLRKKACDRGLEWRDLVDEEVHCVPISP